MSKEDTPVAFVKEPRYIVLKIKDMLAYLGNEGFSAVMTSIRQIAKGRAYDGKPPFNAVVVEQDWPEFEVVWEMIEARVTGKPVAAQEPVAWMCQIPQHSDVPNNPPATCARCQTFDEATKGSLGAKLLREQRAKINEQADRIKVLEEELRVEKWAKAQEAINYKENLTAAEAVIEKAKDALENSEGYWERGDVFLRTECELTLATIAAYQKGEEASAPSDEEPCNCVSTRTYTNGICDTCGGRE